MNKKYIIVTTIAMLIVIIGLIALVVIDPFGEKNRNIEITVKDNAGIPYKWEYEIEDESIVQYERDYVFEEYNNSNIVGGVVYRNYVFKGVKKGDTVVKLKKVNIVDGRVAEEKEYKLKVDKKNNVTLVLEEK